MKLGWIIVRNLCRLKWGRTSHLELPVFHGVFEGSALLMTFSAGPQSLVND